SPWRWAPQRLLERSPSHRRKAALGSATLARRIEEVRHRTSGGGTTALPAAPVRALQATRRRSCSLPRRRKAEPPPRTCGGRARALECRSRSYAAPECGGYRRPLVERKGDRLAVGGSLRHVIRRVERSASWRDPMRLHELITQASSEPLFRCLKRADEVVDRFVEIPRGERRLCPAVKPAGEGDVLVVPDEPILVVGRTRKLVEPALTSGCNPPPRQPILANSRLFEQVWQHT